MNRKDNGDNMNNNDVYNAINLDTCVKERKSFGGPSPESVLLQIKTVRKNLEELCNG